MLDGPGKPSAARDVAEGTDRLEALRVLLVDCQTTGSDPGRHALLEIAWAAGSAADGEALAARSTAFGVALPDGHRVPPRIRRLTGFAADRIAAPGVDTGADGDAGADGVADADGVAGADGVTGAETDVTHLEAPLPTVDGRRLWSLLAEECAALDAGAEGRGLLVAHYARFEERFLRALATRAGVDRSEAAAFPFRTLCTHAMARRLLPELPRHGLRAVAGYLGRTLPERRRATEHVRATALIWRHLVERLREVHGVETLAELDRFLARPAPARSASGARTRWSFPLARARRLGLGEGPGVYRFVAADGAVLYVGKATSLRRRVNSYYRRRRGDGRLFELLAQVHDVDVTETPSGLEAALLEVEEIRRLDPPYNRALRGGERDLWHFARDLGDAARAPDARHPVGPVPGRESFAALAALARLVGERLGRLDADRGGVVATAAGAAAAAGAAGATGSASRASDADPRALGLDRRRLAPGALESGVSRFVAAHDDTLAAHRLRSGRAPLALALLSLGATLRQRELGAGLRAECDADHDAELGADRDTGGGEDAEVLRLEAPPPRGPGGGALIDAGAVCRHLESIVTTASRLRRRARWLALLAGATVVWRREDAAGGHAWQRHEAGMALVGRADHDRLRVLSTEIRRLIAQDRCVQVELATGRTIDAPRLARIMRWT